MPLRHHCFYEYFDIDFMSRLPMSDIAVIPSIFLKTSSHGMGSFLLSKVVNILCAFEILWPG